jgi:hypothetical protein
MSGSSDSARTIDDVTIDVLRADPANPRRISEGELDALERSNRQFGFVQPVLARRKDATLSGGHRRLVAAWRPTSRTSTAGRNPLHFADS